MLRLRLSRTIWTQLAILGAMTATPLLNLLRIKDPRARGFAVGLAAMALLGWLATQPAFFVGLGVGPNLQAANDALALLLFMLATPPFLYFASPLSAHWSRRAEFEADAYARAQTDGGDLAAALLKLHEDNGSTLTPDPVYARFYYSHPPAAERLAALDTRGPGAANAPAGA